MWCQTIGSTPVMSRSSCEVVGTVADTFERHPGDVKMILSLSDKSLFSSLLQSPASVADRLQSDINAFGQQLNLPLTQRNVGPRRDPEQQPISPCMPLRLMKCCGFVEPLAVSLNVVATCRNPRRKPVAEPLVLAADVILFLSRQLLKNG